MCVLLIAATHKFQNENTRQKISAISFSFLVDGVGETKNSAGG